MLVNLISTLILSLFLVSYGPKPLNALPNIKTKTIKTDPVSNKVAKLTSAAADLDPKVLKLAIEAYYHAKSHGEVHNPLLTVIDYSLKSSLKRLWVFDVDHNKLLFHTHVSHGKGTGGLYAKHFSNRAGSHQSSIGVYITGKTYQGDKGLSLRLNGKEKGINDKALGRAIVMHGAWYANPKFIKQNGYAGRSWGCPALPTQVAKNVINKIKKGSLIFAYYPNHQWLSHSKYLA